MRWLLGVLHLGFAVFLLGFGHPSFDLLDALSVGRVVAGKLWWLPASGLLVHAFPERLGLVGIVPRPRHVNQPDVVGFRLLFAAEGQAHPVATHRTKGRHDLLLLLGVHVPDAASDAGLGGLSELFAEHALRPVAAGGVAHLMSEDRG